MRTRPLHEHVLETVFEERRRLASRRGFLTGSAKVVGGGALALGLAAAPRLAAAQDGTPAAAEDFFEDDIAVLNYALTLEHLEATFYRQGLEEFDEADFGQDPLGNSIFDFLVDIRDHEADHVETLTSVINDLGGEPVEEAEYDFGDALTDPAAFLATAQALENTGVSAYDGAAAAISDPELLTAAGTIAAVEARHASYLNFVNGTLPFPAAFETPLSPEEVLEIASPFIVSGEVGEPMDEDDEEATPDS